MTNIATEAKLDALLSLGFIFRIPGGSSRNGFHSSYSLIPYYENGEVHLWVVPYNPNIKKERRYEETFDEEPKGTLELKVLEQTGIRLSEYTEIGTQEAKNNKVEVSSDKHIKYVYLAEKYDESNIRNIASPDTRLDPPVLIEVERLKKYLCPQHQWMLVLFEEKVLAPRLNET
jgi:hypothetical protein